MAQMVIRNLDDGVMEALKRRAVQNRTSAEEEARRALAASVGFDAEAWRARAKALRDEIGPWKGPSVVELLRTDRYGDDES